MANGKVGNKISIGDVNGDGFDDILTNADDFSIFFGPVRRIWADVIITKERGTWPLLNDLNGDKYDDFVFAGEGEITIIDGPILSDFEINEFKSFGVGDITVHSDNNGDLLIGIDSHNNGDGAVFLFYGPINIF